MYKLIVLLVTLYASILALYAAPLGDASLTKRVTHSGKGTWFHVGLGNCGEYNTDSDDIVAISTSIYGDGGNCGQWVHITNTANGKEAWGMTRDSCPSCSSGSLDMSPNLFEQLGSLGTGVLDIEWHFEKKGFSP